jgi:hypothetical protein
MGAGSAEARVAQTLVLAILDELRANPGARQELRTLLDERKSNDRLLSPKRGCRTSGRTSEDTHAGGRSWPSCGGQASRPPLAL